MSGKVIPVSSSALLFGGACLAYKHKYIAIQKHGVFISAPQQLPFSLSNNQSHSRGSFRIMTVQTFREVDM
jgi:hypothetical protein